MVTITVLSGSPLAESYTLQCEVEDYRDAPDVFSDLLLEGKAWKMEVDQDDNPQCAAEWFRTEHMLIFAYVGEGKGMLIVNGKVIKGKRTLSQLFKIAFQQECSMSTSHDSEGIPTVEIISTPEETKPKRNKRRVR